MTDVSDITPPLVQQPLGPPAANGSNGAPRRKPRVRKLRLSLILFGLGVLALISTIFGMMMAVAAELPSLDRFAKLSAARNTVLVDDQGRQLGLLTGPQSRVFVQSGDVAPVMQHAVIAVEDKRFYQNSGFDLRGTARALQQDVFSGHAVQGASTIPQQFIKNALDAQNRRTIFEKLREAALAYHLTRRWSKRRILTAYLNTIYFGEGAYGVESAARVYFGARLGYNNRNGASACGDPPPPGAAPGTPHLPYCASLLTLPEAALLAGIISNPAGYDPVRHPAAATARRNLVLTDMRQQGYIQRADYDAALATPLPGAQDVAPPQEDTLAPYFTSWVRNYLLTRYSPQRMFNGGLRIKTSLDLDLQNAAEQAVNNQLGGIGPSAALVAIQNDTGEVKAMVARGPQENYANSPFNVATQGHRQPGSAWKAFDLATALEKGVSADSVWASQQKTFIVPNSGGKEKFVVNNDEHSYLGSASLTDATAYSDNSIYAEVGIKVGTDNIARTAKSFGIRSPISTNPAMTIGGLKVGVSPLDMAHAYETIAHNGQKVCGALSAPGCGPSGVSEIDEPGKPPKVNTAHSYQELPLALDATETQMLQTVIQYGTGRAAQWGGFAAGKTGTTSNEGDAWFVGFTHDLTVAVWVGYPNNLKSMKYDYNGGPVQGGTFPAQIWNAFISQAEPLIQQQHAQAAAAAAAKGATGAAGAQTTDTSGSSAGNSGSGSSGGSAGAGAGSGSGSAGGSGSGGGAPPGGGGGPPAGGGGPPAGGGGPPGGGGGPPAGGGGPPGGVGGSGGASPGG
ncbi:MAG: hypothetical protein DLM63_06090 [Solirubrobacterales bacterium]|nr:MAG: hypothetical protein DLM63_06090 [Solirubrobacterales bacterium]